MLILIALALGLSATGAITFIVLCLGIVREDRSERLDGRPLARLPGWPGGSPACAPSSPA